MTHRQPTPSTGLEFHVPLAMVAVLSVVATLSFKGAFVSWWFLVPAIAGAGIASGVAWFAASKGLATPEAIMLSLLSFVILGTFAIAGIPSPAAFGALFRGLVSGWTDFLSTAAPVDVSVEFRVIPYTLAWLGVVIGAEVLRSTRRAGLPMVGPLTVAVLTLLLALEDRTVALIEGALLVLGTIALGLVQQRIRTTDERHRAADAHHRSSRGLTISAALLAGLTFLAPVLGPRLPLADTHERFDLRQLLVPPWNPLDAPSPLAQLKSSIKEDRAEEVAFTVSGDSIATRWPIAALADYDGVVWAVADAQETDEGASFVPVGSQLPPDPVVPDSVPADLVTHEVTIGTLGSHWLPASGRAVSLSVDDVDDVRFNVATGTLALPLGLAEGMTYTVVAQPAVELSTSELRQVTMEPAERSAELDLLPPQVRNLAADVVEGVSFGWPQVEAIRDHFTGLGFYDDSSAIRPGHSYARIAEFLDDPERIVGYEELYAATSGVLARVAEVPSRVVVGYLVPEERYVDGTAEVYAGDISAWIEVRTNEFGWVPVDVTPDESREPSDQQLGVTVRDVARPSPPPPPPPPPDVELPQQEDEEIEQPDQEDEEEASDEPLLTPTMALIATTVGVPIIAVAVFAMTVIGLKTRRANRRRRDGDTASRVAGAWAEMLDRYREAGVNRPRQTTPRAMVQWILTQDQHAHEARRELASIAAAVDRAAHAPLLPGDDEVTSAWSECERVVANLTSTRSTWDRIRMRLDPRPLLKRDPTKNRGSG